MHASANWVSWQGTTGSLTALKEYLTVLLKYLYLLQEHKRHLGPVWPTLGYATAHPTRFSTEFFYLLDVATKAIGQRLHDTN